MEKNKEKVKCIIINSNILFSSLIKEDGFTRAALLVLKNTSNVKLLIPNTVVNEFKINLSEISRKSGLSSKNVLITFEKLLENVERLNELDLKDEIKEGIKYVKDEKDTPFVAVALKYRPAYILTYNVKDYKKEKLEKLDILVVTPKDALSSIGVEELEVKTKNKRKKNLLYYFAKLKMFMKK